MLKELQSLALDVRVLRDDNTEVEIMESVDYGDTNLNHIIEGDRYSDREDERFGDYGFSKKEFDGEEMVDVEEDEEEDSYLDLDESSDDDMELVDLRFARKGVIKCQKQQKKKITR